MNIQQGPGGSITGTSENIKEKGEELFSLLPASALKLVARYHYPPTEGVKHYPSQKEAKKNSKFGAPYMGVIVTFKDNKKMEFILHYGNEPHHPDEGESNDEFDKRRIAFIEEQFKEFKASVTGVENIKSVEERWVYA